MVGKAKKREKADDTGELEHSKTEKDGAINKGSSSSLKPMNNEVSLNSQLSWNSSPDSILESICNRKIVDESMGDSGKKRAELNYERTEAGKNVSDNFDPKKLRGEEWKLEFIESNVINEKVIAKVHKEEMQDVVEYWKLSVLCYILGSKPPFYVVNGFLRRLERFGI
ncbi:OLC1v1024188C1 [Oldenlandia corymbosa var. corymbosa]|uniref:OLC1v1024188C1 n=1 Tax=Oldenlandia corymbosa var. corymbosa TaxID=529605 RepID=A0AAV1C4S5_OLDCO|nr:OLC1v1024188C1 [Oldenlandia corymbosa var. corymbosa]